MLGIKGACPPQQMAVSHSASLPLPPGNRGLPWLGETREWFEDPLRFAQERYERYGLVWQTRLIGRPCAVLLGSDANRFILSTHLHLFSSRAGWPYSITSLIGHGLSLIDGPEHRRHRQMIQPAIHGEVLQRYFDVMYQLTREHTARWTQLDQLQLFDAFKHLSFDIAARLLLGLDGQADRQQLFKQFQVFSHGLFTLLSWKVPGTAYGDAWYVGRRLRHMLRELIAARRAAPGDDVLGLLISARDEQGTGFSDDELIDELLVLLWAGHDTVTSLLTWTIYELLQHPDVYTCVLDELEAVRVGSVLVLDQLKHMPLLDRVLREAERLHPPAPGGFRGVVTPFEYGGYTIPAGWTVMYSTVFTHQMPELWHEPMRFDPDRFAPPREEGKKPFQLIGFGGGPRICVGLAFAQMQMRIIIAHLLCNYRFELLPNQDVSPVAVPTKMPKDGLLVRVHLR